uniref:Retinol dehydrogenase 16 n=1 Tax=Mus musculus TaxID=10090 RepID=D6RFT0_MOUSE
MWLYLVALVGLWTLLRFFRVRQVEGALLLWGEGGYYRAWLLPDRCDQ